jgi:hypothetical protein
VPVTRDERIVGTGITTRTLNRISRDAAKHWQSAIERHGGSRFGAETERMVIEAQEVLRQEGDERYKTDTRANFAMRILRLHRLALVERDRGKIDGAMQYALALGRTYTAAVMKVAWEEDALTGQRIREGGRKGHDATYGSTSKRYGPYLATFEALQSDGLSVSQAQRQAAAIHGVATKTIYRARKWGERTHLTVSS